MKKVVKFAGLFLALVGLLYVCLLYEIQTYSIKFTSTPAYVMYNGQSVKLRGGHFFVFNSLGGDHIIRYGFSRAEKYRIDIHTTLDDDNSSVLQIDHGMAKGFPNFRVIRE